MVQEDLKRCRPRSCNAQKELTYLYYIGIFVIRAIEVKYYGNNIITQVTG